jgi:CheY-like chemotaxis protein
MEDQEKQQLEAGLPIIRRALLVEDNAACERVMYCFLVNLGYQVECAGNATTAIQQINLRIYKLIVVDLRLPDRYGADVIHAVRQSALNLDTTLLVWSAHLNKKDHEEYLAIGADRILPKPCTLAYLEEVIQQCLKTPNYKRKFYFQLKRIQQEFRT